MNEDDELSLKIYVLKNIGPVIEDDLLFINEMTFMRLNVGAHVRPITPTGNSGILEFPFCGDKSPVELGKVSPDTAQPTDQTHLLQ